MAEKVLFTQSMDDLSKSATFYGVNMFGDLPIKHPKGIDAWNDLAADTFWAEKVQGFIRHTQPLHCPSDWERYIVELYTISVGGLANSEHHYVNMLAATALVMWCDLHKDINRLNKVMGAMRKLYALGLDIQWASLISEDSKMFKTPSTSSHRQTFGAGIMPVLTRLEQIYHKLEVALADEDDAGASLYPDKCLLAGELQFQLNTFAENIKSNWRIIERKDAEELWSLSI